MATDGKTGENDTISYGYTNAGMLKAIENADEKIDYAYNVKGLTTSEIETCTGRNIEKQYTYDADLNPTGLSVTKDGNNVLSQISKYNNIGQMTGVYKGDGTTPIITYEYDNAGNLTKEKRSNNVETTYAYNESNGLKELANKKGNTVLSSYTYEYYLDGNQAKVTENTGRIQSYSYDGAGRLKDETDTTGTNKNYAYDSNSNRIGMEVTGREQYNVTYIYDQNNRLIKDTTIKGGDIAETEYNYDPNGNLRNKAHGRYTSASGEETASIGLTNSDFETYEYTVRLV